MNWDFLFDSWATIGRTLLVGGLAYIALVFMLRVSGKRTLGKMNSFDLVVTVAIGSTLATILLDRNVSLAEGLTAFALLILLQWAVTWLSVRAKVVREAARSEPALLLHRGRMLPDALRRARVTESEILQAVRSSGEADLHKVEAVVLETDGELSVVRGSGGAASSSLRDVRPRESR